MTTLKLTPLVLILSLNWAFGQEHDPNKKVLEMGIQLDETEAPVANYVSTVKTGNLLFVAGHAARIPGTKKEVQGVVPTEVNIEEAYQAARYTAINLLATLKKELGDLKKIKKIVALDGMIWATPDFKDHSKVMNGASDFFVEVFGKEVGSHTRNTRGYASLPFGATVEISLIVEIA